MACNMAGKRIAWAIDCIVPGSGGLQTICRHASYLQSLGATCDFFVRYYDSRLEGVLLDVLFDSYGCTGVSLRKWEELGAGYDVGIATLYTSARLIASSECEHKCYFVQDYEPYFSAMGDKWLEADQSYSLGLKPITIGNWLVKKLHDEYCIYPVGTQFGVDGAFYHPIADTRKGRAVCAIFQPEKDRRCPELMLDSLATLHEMDPSIELLVYGSTESLPRGFDYVKNLGILTKEECNNLYNYCLCGLSISASNPSRIPYEMMRAGLPVVDLYGENTRYDFVDGTISLAEHFPDAIANALHELMEDEGLREQRSSLALEYCTKHPITIEQEGFARALEIIYEGKERELFEEPEPSYTDLPLSASPESTSSMHRAMELVLAGQQLDIEKRICAQAYQAGLKGMCFKLSLDNVPASLGIEEGCFYLWKSPDQSDLLRIGSRRDEQGKLSAHFALSDDHGPGVYQVHAYCIVGGFEEMAAANVVRFVSEAGPDKTEADSKTNDVNRARAAIDFSDALIDITRDESCAVPTPGAGKAYESKTMRLAQRAASKAKRKAEKLKGRLLP